MSTLNKEQIKNKIKIKIDTGNAKPIKQGLNFLKFTKSKVDFETNIVKTGLTLSPANTHYMPSSNSTIIIERTTDLWHHSPLKDQVASRKTRED